MVEFNRQILFDKELRLNLDEIIMATNNDIKRVIELKVYSDVKYLMEAMHSIMSNKNIESQLTTYPKINLFTKK